MKENTSLGRHIIAEYRSCNPEILNDVVEIEKIMNAAAQQAGATIINSTFHHFSPWGVSGVVVIQESHLAIHTWPEYGYASVDLFTCGGSVNPWVAFKYLKLAFKALQHDAIEMLRGHPELLEKTNFNLEKKTLNSIVKPNPNQLTRDLWFTERTGNFAYSVKHNGGLLFKKTTPFQNIEVYQTPSLGKMLVLDGLIVLTENDEYAYHEMLVHTALFTHHNPQKVLIIGGGDGGAAREVLKHESVKSIDLVEVDELIIETSKKYFPFSTQVFNHSKLNVIIQDAWEFILKSSDTYDIILVDLGSPSEGGEKFYSEEFYQKSHSLLAPNGLFITQIGSPMINKELFKNIFKNIEKVFKNSKTHCYTANIPTFPSGTCGFSYCSKNDIDHLNVSEKKLSDLKNMNLRYYNKQVHSASFALPNFVLSSLI